MVAPNRNVSKNPVINEFINRVKNPALYSASWWAGNSISDMNSSALGPRDVATPHAGLISDTDVVASTVANMAKQYAKYTTVYRRARSGFHITRWGDDGNANYYRNHYVRVARLRDNYQIGYAYSTEKIRAGHELWANELHGFMSALRHVASRAQSQASIVDLRICHSSCHSSCHGSRGRR